MDEAGNALAAGRELRRFAALRLADVKVPRTISIVPEIPRTPTGKPMRTALAGKGVRVDQTEQGASGSTGRPTTLEALVAHIWRNALKTGTLDLDDDFFRLGGDSIMAARIIAHVRQATNVELSFLAFVDSPTVAAIAKCIEAENAVAKTPDASLSISRVE